MYVLLEPCILFTDPPYSAYPSSPATKVEMLGYTGTKELTAKMMHSGGGAGIQVFVPPLMPTELPSLTGPVHTPRVCNTKGYSSASSYLSRYGIR